MLKIDDEVFEENILCKWSLVPYLRYGRVFGLYNSNSLEGFSIFMKMWDNPEFVYLTEIAVAGESQGKGYGYYLLLKSLLHLKKEGLSIVGLTVNPNNSRARHIYCEKFGFKLAEFRKNEYGQGQDRLFLTLDLKNWTPRQC
jgi:[ribosomal protein S18]-alanine N-acetyltransferase